MDTSNKKVVIGIVVLLLVVAAFFVALGRGVDDPQDGEPTSLGPNTYMSREYGISFEKPEGYDVLEVTDPSSKRHSIVLSRAEDTAVPVDGEGPTAITIDVFEDVNTSDVVEWLRANNVSNYNLITGDHRDTTVSDVEAVSYGWDGLYRGKSVAFLHEGSMILVSGTYLEVEDAIYADFDRVVSSIRLQ